MFVQANTLLEIRDYFERELKTLYSPSELKLIVRVLYCNRFKVSDSEYLLIQNERLSESDLLYFHQALKRLRNEEPFQYISGETEFYGLLLKCDQRALIPRPETEELVDWIVQSTPNVPGIRVADWCSGSGCIALGVKSVLPKTHVIAVELSSGALELIRENSALTNLTVEVEAGDVLSATWYQSTPQKSLDVLVSNPPYIPHSDKTRMAKNVLEFEPEMALFVEDEDPLLFYATIISEGKSLLKENGWMYFEIHEDLAREVVQIFERNGFVNIELRKDLQGKDRMVRAQVLPFAP